MWTSKVKNYWQNSDDGKTTRVLGDKNWVSAPPQPKNITIRLYDGNREFFFEISTTAPLSELQEAFAKKIHSDPLSFRYLYEGELFPRNSTAEILGINDHDTIDVICESCGG